MKILIIEREKIPYISDALLEHMVRNGAGKKDDNSFILKTDMGLQEDGNPEFHHYNYMMHMTKDQGFDTLIINFNKHGEFKGTNGDAPQERQQAESEIPRQDDENHDGNSKTENAEDRGGDEGNIPTNGSDFSGSREQSGGTPPSGESTDGQATAHE